MAGLSVHVPLILLVPAECPHSFLSACERMVHGRRSDAHGPRSGEPSCWVTWRHRTRRGSRGGQGTGRGRDRTGCGGCGGFEPRRPAACHESLLFGTCESVVDPFLSVFTGGKSSAGLGSWVLDSRCQHQAPSKTCHFSGSSPNILCDSLFGVLRSPKLPVAPCDAAPGLSRGSRLHVRRLLPVASGGPCRRRL